ncbi:MAG: hypothetical protein KA149_07610 [Chitinophagales bacterium]|nr:hypothetical protein [Chitinophagales bacterium]
MNKGVLLILIFICAELVPQQVYSQKGIAKFIPNRYEILDSASGNLNLDKYNDLILVLRMIGEDTIYNEAPKRPVLILTGNSKGGYTLVSRNDNAVYTHDIGMFDSFSEVQITAGSFSIHHMGGLSLTKINNIHTFTYNMGMKKWMLYKHEQYFTSIQHFEDTDSLDVNETADIKTEKDFGKITFEDFDLLKEYK